MPALTGIRNDSLPFENPDISFFSAGILFGRVCSNPGRKNRGARDSKVYTWNLKPVLSGEAKEIFLPIIV
ncbi:conserved hypothetical protein [Burkholderia cepacia]